MAYYHVLFDRTIDLAFEAIDIGPGYIARTNKSFFVVEVHTCYLDEVRAGETVSVRFRILDHDDKRLHVFEEMLKDGAGTLAATSEVLLVHTDLSLRRVVPWGADVGARIAAARSRDARHGVPERAGRRIAIPRRT